MLKKGIMVAIVKPICHSQCSFRGAVVWSEAINEITGIGIDMSLLVADHISYEEEQAQIDRVKHRYVHLQENSSRFLRILLRTEIFRVFSGMWHPIKRNLGERIQQLCTEVMTFHADGAKVHEERLYHDVAGAMVVLVEQLSTYIAMMDEITRRVTTKSVIKRPGCCPSCPQVVVDKHVVVTENEKAFLEACEKILRIITIYASQVPKSKKKLQKILETTTCIMCVGSWLAYSRNVHWESLLDFPLTCEFALAPFRPQPDWKAVLATLMPPSVGLMLGGHDAILTVPRNYTAAPIYFTLGEQDCFTETGPLLHRSDIDTIVFPFRPLATTIISEGTIDELRTHIFLQAHKEQFVSQRFCPPLSSIPQGFSLTTICINSGVADVDLNRFSVLTAERFCALTIHSGNECAVTFPFPSYRIFKGPFLPRRDKIPSCYANIRYGDGVVSMEYQGYDFIEQWAAKMYALHHSPSTSITAAAAAAKKEKTKKKGK